MIKRLFVSFLLLAASFTAFADTLKSESEARELSERVMAKLASGEIANAFALIKPYSTLPEAEVESLLQQTLSKREQLAGRHGQVVGYEFIGEKKAGESLLRLIYIEKFSTNALPWAFFYYKTPTGWMLNSFAWNDRIQNAF